MRRLLIIIISALVCGMAVSLYYKYKVEPGLVYFWRCADAAEGWGNALRQNPKSCYVFGGGSEIRAGVDPEVMLKEQGIRCISMAVAAGNGNGANARIALEYLRSGDTMVFSLLPGYAGTWTSGGIVSAFHFCGFGIFDEGFAPLTADNLLQLVRPDMASICTYAGKKLFRPELNFKYEKNTVIHPSGWMEVLWDEMQQVKELHPLQYERLNSRVSGDSLRFLALLKEECRRRGAELVLMFPVALSHESMRCIVARDLLDIVRAGYHVLKDERLGAWPYPEKFADTSLHLSPAAARENSLLLGQMLKEQQYWTEEELVEYLCRNGWNADGTPVDSGEGKEK